MNSTKQIVKVLAGVEDFAAGLGVEEQRRQGKPVPVTRVNLSSIAKLATFGTGAIITSKDETLRWPISEGGDNRDYYWNGALPKEIEPGSNPNITGGISETTWIPIANAGGVSIGSAVLVGSTADGLASTNPQEYFLVPANDPVSDIAMILYLHSLNGTATELTKLPSAAYFDSLVLQLDATMLQAIDLRDVTQEYRNEAEDFKNSARDSASLLSDVLDDALASGLNLPLDMGFTDQPVPPANMIDLGEA